MISMMKEADDEECVGIEAMKLTPRLWLEKFEKEGRADEVFFILHEKEYTPRQIASMDYIFWKQVVKSV